jgi:hypothetical protein
MDVTDLFNPVKRFYKKISLEKEWITDFKCNQRPANNAQRSTTQYAFSTKRYGPARGLCCRQDAGQTDSQVKPVNDH